MSKVLGVGNALVDILTQLENDQLLEILQLPKGSMQLVDESAAQKVVDATSGYQQEKASGGSAANTIHGLATLGIDTGFVGKVGDDDLGAFFRNDMSDHTIMPHITFGSQPTGKANALISPDSERTFATYLGSAVELSSDDLSDEMFKNYKYLHVEGYLVLNQDLIETAFKIAKRNGLITCIDLASFNVVEDNLEFLTKLVNDYVDIVFANEEEAKAYTGTEGRDALDILAENVNIAVLKLGKSGSMIKRGDEVVQVGVIDVKAIDTTGAGDLYAAGFIYGLINGFSLEKCGRIGAILSGHVIEKVGPKMDENTWTQIKSEIAAL